MEGRQKQRRVEPTEAVRDMDPYTVSESATLSNQEKNDFLKLDWNELTLKPSPKVREHLQEFVRQGHFEYYPDVIAKDLRKKLADYVGASFESVQVFNGSDDAIRAILDAFVGEGDTFLAREPTYTQPYTFVQSNGGNVETFTGSSPFTKEIDEYERRLRNDHVKVTYIPNPNNPTGVQYSSQEVERLVEQFPETVFVVDEAYSEFADVTSVGLVEKYDNLVVSRTFSKAFGLAGLRLGYIVASPSVLESVNKVRNGKSVNIFAQVGVTAALYDLEHMWSNVEKIREARRWFSSVLREMGLEVHTTCANFVLVRVGDVDAVMDELEAANILVRDRSHLPQLSGYVRISVGDKEQMRECKQTLDQLPDDVLGIAEDA